MKQTVLKPRSRGQKAFCEWLKEAKPQLQIDIEIEKQTRREIEFSFAGMPKLLRGMTYFRRYKLPSKNARRISNQKKLSGGMMVFVDWQNTTWDLLVSWDAFPVRIANGYVCDQCLPEYYRIFESREAIWKDHLFGPLLKWINLELKVASAIGIYQTRDGGATWAKLLRQDEEDKEADCLIAQVDIER